MACGHRAAGGDYYHLLATHSACGVLLMTSLPDRSDPPFGEPGIWDPMPLVPPVRPPVEPDDSQLIWSKPRVPARGRDTQPAKAGRRSSKKKATRRTKKAGRVKKRR